MALLTAAVTPGSEQQQQQQHPQRSRAAASLSLQLPPARLVLPVLGLPGCLSHTCSAHPSESCQRREQTKDEHTAVSRWKLHTTRCWVLCHAPDAAKCPSPVGSPLLQPRGCTSLSSAVFVPSF